MGLSPMKFKYQIVYSKQAIPDSTFRGTVLKVKVLGVFAMIDEGEFVWKLMAIDVLLFTNSQIQMTVRRASLSR